MNKEIEIKKHVEYLRKKYSLGIYPNEVEKMCNECDFETMYFADNNNFVYEQINTSFLGITEPFHKSSLIGYNTDNGPIWYIIDPTYGQFFENKKFKTYMMNNYPDFSEELLKQGYIKCTLNNLLSYIKGFTSSKVYTNNINEEEVFLKVDDLLHSQNIVNRDIVNTRKKLIELLKLRKELLNNSNYDDKRVTEYNRK